MTNAIANTITNTITNAITNAITNDFTNAITNAIINDTVSLSKGRAGPLTKGGEGGGGRREEVWGGGVEKRLWAHQTRFLFKTNTHSNKKFNRKKHWLTRPDFY